MKRKKLVVCLDGLGHNMISRENTPFLYSYSRENNMAELKTLLAFTGVEFSFFSGEFPDKHDVWLEFAYSPATSPFKWQKNLRFLGRRLLSLATALRMYASGSNFLTKLYNIPFDKLGSFDVASRKNIWDLRMFRGRKHVCLKWPFIVKDGRRSIIFRYKDDRERCKTLIESIDDETEVYAVQLVGLDKVMHKHGFGREAREKMKEIDSLARETVEAFMEKVPDLDVILWSDHGFVDVKRYVDLQSMMPERDDYMAFYAGTTASFWFKSKDSESAVMKKLRGLEFGEVLSRGERKRYHIPASERHGELIFALKPGIMIFPNYYQRGENERFRMMHGYPPDRCDSNGILITNIKLRKGVMEMPEVLRIMD